MRPSPGGRAAGTLSPDPGPPKPAASGLGLPGLPAPDPGNFLYAQKVTKKAPAPFGLDPRFCPIGRLQGSSAQPLRRCGASGLLVIGLAVISLRLTALGLRD